MKHVVALWVLLCSTAAFGATVDATRSVFTWTGSKVTGSFHTGNLSPVSSAIDVENGRLVGGTVVLDLRTFTVTDLQGRWAVKFLTHMKSTDFFDVAAHPTATLTMTAVANGRASGTLTIRGKSAPVTFPVAERNGGYFGSMVFDRTKFGMIYKSGNFFADLGDKVINDEVKVDFEVYLVE